MFHAFILGMDAFALGLLNAEKIIKDGRLDQFVKDRYSSFEKELGQKILSQQTTLKELSDHACQLKKPQLPSSGSQESLQSLLNQILFG